MVDEPTNPRTTPPHAQSEPARRCKYSRNTLMIACLICGNLGVHRFMVGKIGTGLMMLFTFGLLGIWVAHDLVALLNGTFTDKYGNVITD